jgi:hypothetical protein
VVLTRDERIRYRPAEREALIRAGVAAFVLVARRMTGPEMAATFVAALPAMRRLSHARPRPFIAAVGRRGNVRVVT